MKVSKDSYSNSIAAYSDAELVARCIAGDPDVFGALMSRYGTFIRRKISRFRVSQTTAEDLEQEIWIKAFKNLGELRNDASFRTWLMQITDTTCLSHIRKHNRRLELAPVVDVDPEAVEALPRTSDPLEDLAAVTRLLDSLPPQYSDILTLRYVKHMPMQEIAAQVGLSLSGVKWRLNQAKQVFQKAFEEAYGCQTDADAVLRLMHSAHDAAQASQWQEAMETYEIALRKGDLDWYNLQTLGRIYERRGDFRRAIKLLEQAQRINYWPWISVIIAWCYDGLGERETAVAIYEEVLQDGDAGPWTAAAALSGMKAPHKRRKSEPEPIKNERAVPRYGWSVKTNHNPDEANLAIDSDLSTRWRSLAPQSPNMYFELDLGKEWPVTRAVFDDDGGGQCVWIADCPHGYAIETSLDRQQWKTVATGIANGDKYAGAVMDGSPIRYIKIRLTEDFFPNWWGIYEIRVYARK